MFSTCVSFFQTVLLKLLQHWGHDGYLKHCERVEQHYAKKRDQCVAIAKKHLDGELLCLC